MLTSTKLVESKKKVGGGVEKLMNQNDKKKINVLVCK